MKENISFFIDLFFENNHIPIFLIDANIRIIHSPKNFFDFPKNFFIPFKEKILNNTKKLPILYENEFFYCCIKQESHTLIIGPIRHFDHRDETIIKSPTINNIVSFIEDKELLLNKIPYADRNFFNNLQMLYTLFTDQKIDIHHVINDYLNVTNKITVSGEYNHQLFTRREYREGSYSYQDELALLHFVKIGNNKGAMIAFKNLVSKQSSLPFSNNLTNNIRYALVSLITNITRAVIQVGVNDEIALSLSDAYMQRVDLIFDGQQARDIALRLIDDFCRLVNTKDSQVYPLWIRQIMTYIQSNCHEKITLDDLSKLVYHVPSYISSEFKKYTNMSIVHYIHKVKIEESKFLLKNTPMSMEEISVYLSLSNSQYFSTLFKKMTGMSPSQYRHLI